MADGALLPNDVTNSGCVALLAQKQGVVVPIVVKPRSKTNGVAGVHARSLIIRVTAAPVDGAANAAVVAVLAECLDLPKSAITLVRGHKARRKVVAVSGLSVEEMHTRLAALLAV